jgi:hypothetical protein
MLSPEFHRFHAEWRAKADQYQGPDLQSAFDRFFTLFVIYNRLYAEVTFHMARNGRINLTRRTNFPDGNAATDYVMQFLGGTHTVELFEADPECTKAIQAVIALLAGPTAEGRQFAIKLDMIYGQPQRGADLELLRKLRSRSRSERGTAILEFLYAIRCNLFHGHKGFDDVQLEIMRPANILLSRIVEVLFENLDVAPEPVMQLP